MSTASPSTTVRAVCLPVLMVLVAGMASAADSTYSGGSIGNGYEGGLWGPWNLGERAEYGKIACRANQEFTWDDNLFLVETGKVSDWASVSTPSLSWLLGTPSNNSVELAYNVNVVRYLDRTDEDGEEHHPSLGATFTLGRTRLKLTDDVECVTGGTNRLGGNEIAARVDKTTNRVSMGSDTELSDKVSLGLSFNRFDYDPKGGLIEHWQMDGGATVYYRAFAKADIFVAANGGRMEQRDGLRQDFISGSLGARGTFTPTLTGRASVGGEYRESSLSTVGDNGHLIFSGALTQVFDPLTTLTLRAGRSVESSISQINQTYVNTSAGFRVDYQFGPSLDASGSTRKFLFGLDYQYDRSDFDLPSAGNPAQRANLHTAAVSLEYRIQDCWKVYVVYRFQDNGSNLTGNDYRDNRVSLGTSLQF
ncbi:MAG: outer membrane beta-barrel protein [Verrucomicrobiia bacterium]